MPYVWFSPNPRGPSRICLGGVMCWVCWGIEGLIGWRKGKSGTVPALRISAFSFSNFMFYLGLVECQALIVCRSYSTSVLWFQRETNRKAEDILGSPPKNKKQQPTFGHCFEQCRAPVRWLRCSNQKSWFLFPKAGSEDPGEHPKIGAFGLDFGPASSRTGAGVGLGWIGHKDAY